MTTASCFSLRFLGFKIEFSLSSAQVKTFITHRDPERQRGISSNYAWTIMDTGQQVLGKTCVITLMVEKGVGRWRGQGHGMDAGGQKLKRPKRR